MGYNINSMVYWFLVLQCSTFQVWSMKLIFILQKRLKIQIRFAKWSLVVQNLPQQKWEFNCQGWNVNCSLQSSWKPQVGTSGSLYPNLPLTMIFVTNQARTKLKNKVPMSWLEYCIWSLLTAVFPAQIVRYKYKLKYVIMY